MSLYSFEGLRPKRLRADVLASFDKTLAEIVTGRELNPKSKDATKLRLDLLTRLIEVLRFERGHYTCELAMEEFIAMNVFPDSGRIVVANDRQPPRRTTGFDAIQMQPLLLQYLVTRIERPETIYDTIERFIHRIERELTVLDFQRSLTGVLRCFTNARVAASRLGRYGLIRAAPGDVSRKWVPSLPGLVVAYLLSRNRASYQSRRNENMSFWIVHPAIRHIWQEVEKYDAFLGVIRAVCLPNMKAFDTFEPVLHSMHEMLAQFFSHLMHGEKKERDEVIKQIRAGDSKKAVAVLREIETDDRYEEFVRQFGLSLQMLDLLGDNGN